MPGPDRTTIEFVAGGQSAWLRPSEVAAWRLPVRFAVVQDTYRPDMTDAYVDKALWLRLCEFAQAYSATGTVTAVQLRPDQRTRSPTQKDEVSLEAYFSACAAILDDDWDAPERVIVRETGVPVLVIAAEYWVHVGGPHLYHDSMTYSIYATKDVSRRVMQFLVGSEAAAGWNLARDVIPAPDPLPPTCMDRVFSWLRRHA